MTMILHWGNAISQLSWNGDVAVCLARFAFTAKHKIYALRAAGIWEKKKGLADQFHETGAADVGPAGEEPDVFTFAV